jgi:hypothetical protein
VDFLVGSYETIKPFELIFKSGTYPNIDLWSFFTVCNVDFVPTNKSRKSRNNNRKFANWGVFCSPPPPFYSGNKMTSKQISSTILPLSLFCLSHFLILYFFKVVFFISVLFYAKHLISAKIIFWVRYTVHVTNFKPPPIPSNQFTLSSKLF